MYVKLVVVLSVLAVEIKSQAEVCNTPNNEQGRCISLYSCPVLLEALLTSQMDPSASQFVRKSNCGGTSADPMVCCGPSANFIVSEKNNTLSTSTTNSSLSNSSTNNSMSNLSKNNSMSGSNRNVTRLSLIPDRRYCGLQHSDDYFHTTNTTAITEFPWLAWIRYRQNSTGKDLGFKCSGSLINNKYVLTAATCVFVPKLRFVPSEVRLGEYHVSNDTDCTQDSHFLECSSPPEDFGIEEYIPHPNYSTVGYDNNVGLIRLNRTVQYSDYIRPICLPLPGTKFANIGDILTSSGWGLTVYGGKPAEIKKKSLGTLQSNEGCSKTLSVFPNIRITKNHLCTVQFSNETDLQCNGDGGGPVMFSYMAQWHQEGIVSHGARCGMGYPDIQTRVANYVDWIVENVKP